MVVQMAEKKLRQAKAREADTAAARQLDMQLLAEKQRLKAEKLERSAAMRQTAHQQRKAINAETRNRFNTNRGAMTDAERKFQSSVLQVGHTIAVMT